MDTNILTKMKTRIYLLIPNQNKIYNIYYFILINNVVLIKNKVSL